MAKLTERLTRRVELAQGAHVSKKGRVMTGDCTLAATLRHGGTQLRGQKVACVQYN